MYDIVKQISPLFFLELFINFTIKFFLPQNNICIYCTIDSTITFDINYIYACATQKIEISEFKAYRAKRCKTIFSLNILQSLFRKILFSISQKK